MTHPRVSTWGQPFHLKVEETFERPSQRTCQWSVLVRKESNLRQPGSSLEAMIQHISSAATREDPCRLPFTRAGQRHTTPFKRCESAIRLIRTEASVASLSRCHSSSATSGTVTELSHRRADIRFEAGVGQNRFTSVNGFVVCAGTVPLC